MGLLGNDGGHGGGHGGGHTNFDQMTTFNLHSELPVGELLNIKDMKISFLCSLRKQRLSSIQREILRLIWLVFLLRTHKGS